MPMTFPSHQGLIAPLWRRWPGVFDVRALCVGAAMPDVVDAALGLFRGRFHQDIGHSLTGALLLGIPGGVLLWIVVRRLALRMPAWRGASLAAFLWNRGWTAMAGGGGARDLRLRAGAILLCLAIGAFSHLLIDLVSHRGFPWLLPWGPRLDIFPDWWHDPWLVLSLPWRARPLQWGLPRFLWIGLSAWGAWLLAAPAIRAWRAGRSRPSSAP